MSKSELGFNVPPTKRSYEGGFMYIESIIGMHMGNKPSNILYETFLMLHIKCLFIYFILWVGWLVGWLFWGLTAL